MQSNQLIISWFEEIGTMSLEKTSVASALSPQGFHLINESEFQKCTSKPIQVHQQIPEANPSNILELVSCNTTQETRNDSHLPEHQEMHFPT